MTRAARLDRLHDVISGGARDGHGRRDGLTTVFESVATGQPVGSALTRYTPNQTLGPYEIEGLLAHDWRARREITQPAWDLVRKGMTIEGLPTWVDQEALMSQLWGKSVDGESSSSPMRAIGELWAEGESYAGAILIAIAVDGREPSEPLDLDNLIEVTSWEVLDRYSVMPFRPAGIGGKVEQWLITGQHGRILPTLTSTSQIVHPSRVIVHAGSWMPRRWMAQRNGWGLSRLEILRDQRHTVATGNATLGRMLERSTQDVVKIAEMAEMQAEYGDAYVAQRLSGMNTGLSSFHWLALDGGIDGASEHEPGRKSDEFETMARPLSGAAPIAEGQHQDWRRGSSMPPVVADGEVQGGINSGESAGAWRSWGGTIDAEQQRSIIAKVDWAIRLILASETGPSGGRVPDNWTTTGVPIAEPDHELLARTALLEGQLDKLSFDMGALREKESRQWRNVDDKGGRVQVESADLLPQPEPPAPPVAPVDPAEPLPIAVADQADAPEPKAAVVITIPPAIAKLFPHQPGRPPPHVTVLFIGPTPETQLDAIREVVARGSSGMMPMRARLGELGYFDNADGSRVAWIAVDIEPDLDEYHEQLRAELMASGVIVNTPGRPFAPHATLEIHLDPGVDYTGPVPSGEWKIERLDVWHGEAG